MNRSGVWNQRYDEIDDLTRARRLPSPQLVGTRGDARPQRARRHRCRSSAARRRARRAGALLWRARNLFALADLKLDDCWIPSTIDDRQAGGGLGAPHRFEPHVYAQLSPLQLGLAANIRSMAWATGTRPDWPQLRVPVLDEGTCATTAASWQAGMYARLPVLRRRKSTFTWRRDDARRRRHRRLSRHAR
jgi:putative flavoprotein involved in K+ transport